MKEPKLRAAIYARKSNDDSNRHADNKSVARQVAHAKQYAKGKGWVVDDQNIYVDDNISGATFKRPGLLRMLNSLKEHDVIVMSEHSRLGREQTQLAQVLAGIYSQGKRIFLYLTNEELRFRTALDKFLMSAMSFASELEREKASQRSRDALELRARQGRNTGGRCYGYENIWVSKRGTKQAAKPGMKKPEDAYTEYAINEAEANVVRGIFTARLDGCSLKAIAKALNGDPKYQEVSRKYFGGVRIASPKKGSGSWAPSGIRTLLANPRYTGKIPWGKHHKEDDISEGRKRRIRQAEFLLVDAPHLRIVDDQTWSAVQRTLRSQHGRKGTAEVEKKGQMNGGRRGWSGASRFLLTGLAHCATCGSAIVGTTRAWGSGEKAKRVQYYYCNFNKARGSSVCDNNHAELAEGIEGRVLDGIEKMLLTPAALDSIIKQAYQMTLAEKKLAPNRPAEIEREIAKKEHQLKRYVDSFGELDDMAPSELLAGIEQRKQEIAKLKDELDHTESVQVPTKFELKRIRKELGKTARQFKRALRRDIPTARQVLRGLLTAPLKFHPVERDGKRQFKFKGALTVAPLIDPLYAKMASPRGVEPLLPP